MKLVIEYERPYGRNESESLQKININMFVLILGHCIGNKINSALAKHAKSLSTLNSLF